MAFLSTVFKGVVGNVPIEAVTEIKDQYESDPIFIYAAEGPEEVRDVPIGAKTCFFFFSSTEKFFKIKTDKKKINKNNV